QGVDEHLALAEALGGLDRPGTPQTSSGDVVGEHPQLRHVAVGHRKLPSIRECFQQLDCLMSRTLSGSVVAAIPVQARQPPLRVALPPAVTTTSMLGKRLKAGVDRVLARPGQVALIRTTLEQL